MKHFREKPVILSILIFCFLFVHAMNVFAQGEKVPGSSGVKPLKFVSCTLADGREVNGKAGITLQPTFTLQFDKNVINMLVWENNKKSITLLSEDHQSIPIEVSKIDDTVDFDHRQQIFVKTVSPLVPGKNYTLKISPDLKAANNDSTLKGSTNGEGVTISFKTTAQGLEKSATKTSDEESILGKYGLMIGIGGILILSLVAIGYVKRKKEIGK